MSSEHPDEGTIHAWLDGALGDAEAARVAGHVAGCAACSAAAAEARGLIAGASRVVRALDEPAGAGRPFTLADTSAAGPAAGLAAEPSPVATRWRVTPARAAIAATLLVAIGLTLSRQYVAKESEVGTLGTSSSVARSAPAAAPALPPHRDPLLDSAIGRAVAQTLPRRSLDRPADAGLPRPERPAQLAAVDTVAAERVAVGRQADVARRDSAPVAADNVMAMAKASTGAVMGVRKAAPLRTEPESQCYRVESAVAGARWGTVSLPFVVTLDSASGDAGTARVSGTDGEMHATWRRLGADSLAIELREAGQAGRLELAGGGAVVGGSLRSLAAAPALAAAESRAEAGAPAPSAVRAKRRAAAAPQASAAPSAPAPMSAPVEVRATRCR